MQQVLAQEIEDKLEAETLQRGSIFGAMSAEAIHFLLAKGKLYRVNQGDVLFQPGDPGNSFFVVCQGSVDFHKYHEGKFSYIRSSGFGEEVGFVAMIALHDHVGKTVARENGMVLEITSRLFAELHDQYSYDFGVMLLNLTRDLARVVRKLSNALVDHAVK